MDAELSSARCRSPSEHTLDKATCAIPELNTLLDKSIIAESSESP